MTDLRSELRDLHAKVDAILRKLDVQNPTTAGAQRTPDGVPFFPGTGALGGSGVHQPDDEDLPPGSPAQAKAALAATRPRTEGDQT